MDTAGLKWPPEIGPSAYAPDSTVRPKANDTPSSPIPTSGKAAASTALPQPPRTSQNVPMNSAVSLEVTAHSFAGATPSRPRWFQPKERLGRPRSRKHERGHV